MFSEMKMTAHIKLHVALLHLSSFYELCAKGMHTSTNTGYKFVDVCNFLKLKPPGRFYFYL